MNMQFLLDNPANFTGSRRQLEVLLVEQHGMAVDTGHDGSNVVYLYYNDNGTPVAWHGANAGYVAPL